MQLRFLGQPYSTSDNQVEAIPTGYTARFRGQTYVPNRPAQPFKSKLGLRKYRGVSYGG